MRVSISTRLAAVSALGLVLPAQAQQSAVPIDPIERIIAPFAKQDAPGCAIAAEHNGRLLASRAFGMADLEHNVRNSPDTVFEAGSVSKQFTAAATLLLVEDNRISLDDNIRKYLPEMPDYGTPITVDQLLHHTSGLRDWGFVAAVAGWPRGTRAYNNDDALRIASAQRSLNYVPGAEYSYTNTGYNLLAVIVERVSGQSLAEFTKARLFEPLGMTHTGWRDDFQRVVKDRAIAYEPISGGGYREARPFENVYGNGGLLTTVGDLMIWNRALTQRKLGERVSARMEERAILTSGRRVTYARGLEVSEYKGAGTVSHSGSTGGYRAWLERFPARQFSVAVLCNGGDMRPGAMARQWADAVLGLREAPVKNVSVKNSGKRTGMFVNEATGEAIWLDLENGSLKLRDGPVLAAVGRGTWRGPAGDYVFNSADSFTLITSEGQPIRFTRAGPSSGKNLEAYAGTYVASEADDARYQIRATDGALTMRLLDRKDPTIGAPVVLKPTYKDAFQGEGGRIVRFEAGSMILGVPRVRALKLVKQ